MAWHDMANDIIKYSSSSRRKVRHDAYRWMDGWVLKRKQTKASYIQRHGIRRVVKEE